VQNDEGKFPVIEKFIKERDKRKFGENAMENEEKVCGKWIFSKHSMDFHHKLFL
jgi:hypothetical protein